MQGLLNRKISTKTGIIVLILVASFAGWLMIRSYIKLLEIRINQQYDFWEKK